MKKHLPHLSRPPAVFRGLLATILLVWLALPAFAARSVDERLREIATLAEQDQAKARTMLVQEGPGLIAGAPY